MPSTGEEIPRFYFKRTIWAALARVAPTAFNAHGLGKERVFLEAEGLAFWEFSLLLLATRDSAIFETLVQIFRILNGQVLLSLLDCLVNSYFLLYRLWPIFVVFPNFLLYCF